MLWIIAILVGLMVMLTTNVDVPTRTTVPPRWHRFWIGLAFVVSGASFGWAAYQPWFPW